jgi:hypothetical protein
MMLAEASGVLLVVLFVIVFAIVVVFAAIAAAKRRKDMARLAALWGYRYCTSDPGDVAAQYAGLFDLFKTGHSRRAKNLLFGREGAMDLCLFDYQYTTGSGKNSHTSYFQVVLMGLPIVAPRLQVRPESFLDTLASWVGHDDLDFESAEFSRRYHVKCSEPKFAYDVLHARLIEQLLALPGVPHLEMRDTFLMLYVGRGGVEKFQWLRTAGLEVVGGLPEYVLKDRGTGRA